MLVKKLILNGVPRKAVTDPKKNLLKAMKLPFTNDWFYYADCCGTCAVIVDGEIFLSCKYSAAKVRYKKTTTIGKPLVRMERFIDDPVTAVVATSNRGVEVCPSKTEVTYGTAWTGSDYRRCFEKTNRQGSLFLRWGRSKRGL